MTRKLTQLGRWPQSTPQRAATPGRPRTCCSSSVARARCHRGIPELASLAIVSAGSHAMLQLILCRWRRTIGTALRGCGGVLVASEKRLTTSARHSASSRCAAAGPDTAVPGRPAAVSHHAAAARWPAAGTAEQQGPAGSRPWQQQARRSGSPHRQRRRCRLAAPTAARHVRQRGSCAAARWPQAAVWQPDRGALH